MLPRPARLCRPRRSPRPAHPRKPRLLDVGRRIPARDRFAPDSPLEGDGFELSVPGRETVKPSWETGLLSRKRERICWGTEGSNPSPSSGESSANLIFGVTNSAGSENVEWAMSDQRQHDGPEAPAPCPPRRAPLAGCSLPHLRRGSRRDDGSGSFFRHPRLAQTSKISGFV